MTLQECYAKLNGNYKEALGRLMNEKLIDRFILKFPADNSMQILRDAVASNDIQESFRGAHTLKGVAANLAFTELSKTASELTEQLRSLEAPADPTLYEAVEKSYQLVIDILDQYSKEK